MTWTDERKLQQLIETGSLENIELALSIVQSNQINLDIEKYEALYQWLWEREWVYQDKGIAHYEEDLSRKIFQLFSIKSLHLNRNETNPPSPFLANLILLRNLEKLSLVYTDLTTIPLEICQLNQGLWLNLRSNLCEMLPDYFAKMKGLKRLWLSQNKFKIFPQIVFQLTSLEYLALEYNKIQDISGDWENFELLKELILYNNEIKLLPPNLAALKNIERIDFSYNQVESVPSNFFDLRNLINLNGNNNKISIIPSAIQKMTNLEVFSLRNNNLTSLPDEIFDLPNLKTLDLSNNPFSKEERRRIRNEWNSKPMRNLYI